MKTLNKNEENVKPLKEFFAKTIKRHERVVK